MKKILFLLILVAPTILLAQKTFKNKQYQFEMQEPDGWLQADNSIIIKNLEKIDFDDAELKKLISDHKGSLLLTSYYKYDPKTKKGIIPTIQVNVRTKGKSTYAEFKNTIIQSAKGFRQTFPDFEFIKQLQEVVIGGIKCIYFVGKFSMKSQDGSTLKVRSRTYAIPYKDYFFQLNFTDAETGEDCSAEFDKIFKTIRIGS